MVLKGRGKYPKKEPPLRDPPTLNIIQIASLKRFETHEKALDLLHEVAKMATPLIEHFGFKVGLLCEMYPQSGNLLGLNVNGGQKICLRLRSPTNPNWFLEIRDILGTLLHELTHNKYGPHNESFFKYLEELKDKYYELELERNGSANLSAISNITVFKPNGVIKNSRGGGIGGENANSDDVRLKRLKKFTGPTTRTGKVGTNLSIPLSSTSIRDLMRGALDRRIPEMETSSCSQLDTTVAPEDDELTIKEIINLISDDEREEKIKLNKELKDTHDELIILD